MSIKKHKKVEILKNNLPIKIKINETVLLETLHVFNQQYILATDVSNAIIANLKIGNKHFSFDATKYNCGLKIITIEIELQELLGDISGSLNQLTRQGDCCITIRIGNKTLLSYGDKTTLNLLKNIVAHELMHAKFIVSKAVNGNKIDQTSFSPLYGKIVNFLKTTDKYDKLYRFIYAFYTLFGNEVNALVSQCHGEIDDYLRLVKYSTTATLVEALKNSDAYQTFADNNNIFSTILSLPVKTKTEFLRALQSKIGCESEIPTIGKLDKTIKKLKQRNDKAIRNCQRTAVFAMYNKD